MELLWCMCGCVYVCVRLYLFVFAVSVSMYYCIVNADENAIVMLSPYRFVFVSPKCHCIILAFVFHPLC